ncbi:hypothetical protein TSAR_007827 [Trichomalopsis sarcophagae]|uniref:Uncharacterized protein n=1 Tax=Trichomalopsis sarcophagae TaxID=543379 RepID=A0A232EDX4_9HYME|nr:hypothetical protein TSAR_007827 [Trichomalopsis sarcophagae]
MQSLARNNLINSKVNNKKYYDKRARPLKLEVGEEVKVLKDPRYGKLDKYYNGQFIVKEIRENNNVVVKSSNGKLIVWRTLLLTLIWLPSYQGLDVESPPFYKLTKLKQNPVTWDLSKWENPVIWREKQMVKMSDTYKEKLGIEECRELIPTHKFIQDLKLRKSLNSDIDVFFAKPAADTLPRFSSYTHTLAKRGVPLEFVGWISRQLFGTMGAGDRDQLNQDIDAMYQRTANI